MIKRQILDEMIMDKFLKNYLDRINPSYKEIDKKTGHQLASLFLSYRFGLYSNVISQSPDCCKSLPDIPPVRALKRAIWYLKERSVALEESKVPVGPDEDFSPEEIHYLPMHLNKEQFGDMPAYVLANSLVLLFAVSFLTSPDDEETLEEHEKYVMKFLNLYMKHLN